MTVDPKRALLVGVDFGTLSGRALVVRVADGAELGSGIYECKHGVVDDRFRLPAFCCRLIGAQLLGCGENKVMHHLRDLRRRTHSSD
jgi:ribulose kinase